MSDNTTTEPRYIADGARVLDTQTGLIAPMFNEPGARRLASQLNKRRVYPEQLKWHEVAK